MNKILKTALLSLMALPMLAGNSATYSLTLNSSPITKLSVSSASRILDVNAAVAGQAPSPALNSGSSMSITTNEGTKKVTAELTTNNLPSSGILKLSLSGGTVTGTATYASQITLSNLGPMDLISNLDEAVVSAATLNYELAVAVSEDVGAYNGSVVTFTIEDQ